MLVADRYEIRSMVGKGGMGQVFKALDRASGREVALKTLHPKYAGNKQALSRFVREVKLARQLHHPGIVKVFDARQWQETLFYTMEYLDGRSLRQWLREDKRLSLRATVRVLCLVCEALDHAHSITIHRDLSPENVMVLPDGSIRVLDFGLAKLDDKFKGLTRVGFNLGKIDYMAPEQEQDASMVDHRADLYSLGVMFYELLAGRPPRMMFEAAMEKQLAVMETVKGCVGPFVRLTDIRPELPPETNAFVEKALAKNPVERFSSAVEFRGELLKLYTAYRKSHGAAPVPVGDERTPNPARPGILGRLKSFLLGRFPRNQRRHG